MYALLITYELDGIDEAEFRAASVGDAGAAEGSPGLLARVGLSDPETNTYGAFTLWRDEDTMHAYMRSPRVRLAVGQRYLRNVLAHTFAADDVAAAAGLTAVARAVAGSVTGHDGAA